MKKDTIKIRFEPIGAEVEVTPPISVMMAAAEAGIALEHPCGGLGVCGKCIVKIRDHIEHSQADLNLLSPEEIEDHCYLSCQTLIDQDAVIECKAGRKTEAGMVMIDGVNAPIELEPRVKRIRVKLTPPTLRDQKSDASRLLHECRRAGEEVNRINFGLLPDLPHLLRDNRWHVEVICIDEEIVSIRSVQEERKILGVAVDLGTTTVVVSLNDLETGEELCVLGAANEQIVYGQDILSRVNTAIFEENGLQKLQDKIIQTVNRMIQEMLDTSGLSKNDIFLVQAVGNTVMQQLFLGIDPEPIATSPFTAAVSEAVYVPTSTFGIHSANLSYFSFSPIIAGYVGGDIVADLLATGLHQARYPSLLVDIGTNAEIVLGCREKMVSCSSPAGPAFEGGHIYHGMRGINGAIESIWVEENDIRFKVIGDEEPAGICGSGLIDALSVLLQLNVVDKTGRLLSRDVYSGPDWVRERLVPFKKGHAFYLTYGPKGSIHITDKDVRAVQLAKGAVQAGIRILLKEWMIPLEKIDTVFICGAFGSKINPESARYIGLIPPVSLEKVMFLGNTAHVGAKRMLLSCKESSRGVSISEKVCYFEVSGLEVFQDIFGLSLGFDQEWILS